MNAVFETVVDDDERKLAAAIQDGLPLHRSPFAALGRRLGISESRVLQGVSALLERRIIRRLGIVVRHRALGYTANAMVVWDVPDTEVDVVGAHLSALPAVTLCYRRPRRLPDWPYNLFCMIHGRDREAVSAQIVAIAAALPQNYRHEILFSRRCFKQRGARYIVAQDRSHG